MLWKAGKNRFNYRTIVAPPHRSHRVAACFSWNRQWHEACRKFFGAMRLTRQIKGPGACPGPERTTYSSVATAAPAATAAIGTLVSDVPGAVLRIERIVPGLRRKNGGEGEQ